MVHVWVAGKTEWSHCYTQVISECFRDKELIIKRYMNSSVYFTVNPMFFVGFCAFINTDPTNSREHGAKWTKCGNHTAASTLLVQCLTTWERIHTHRHRHKVHTYQRQFRPGRLATASVGYLKSFHRQLSTYWPLHHCLCSWHLWPTTVQRQHCPATNKLQLCSSSVKLQVTKHKSRRQASNPQALTLSPKHVTYKHSKLGQTDLVSGWRSEFISRSMYAGSKALCVTCTMLVNTQMHTHSQLSWNLWQQLV